MIIGYLRVSTGKQNPANQQDEIRRFADSRNLSVSQWVTEIASGKKKGCDRKLGGLIRRMKHGDTLIVTEISRLSRTLTDLMAIMGKCLEKGINLYTTKEGYSFDNSINSKVLCFAFGLVAEIERNLISMRTKEALALRKAEGVVLGRKKGSYTKMNVLIENGSPDKSGGKFFNSIENLHLCTMNNQGLLALAQLILPSEILSNFEVVRVEEEASLIRIYLDESVKAEYKENPEIESKGFCEAVTIRDFPIRDKGVDLIVRRRKWYDKQNNRYFSDSYDLKAEETRYSKEFAAFLKGVYGDDSYDLPFA